MRLRLWIWVYLWLPPAALMAQRYTFKEYGLASGLQNLALHCVMQDRAGFLWVGTQNGLFRFDGSRFDAFYTADGLPSSRIESLHETPDGSLWVGTRAGLARKRASGFERIDFRQPLEMIGSDGFASDAAGRLYVSSSHGLLLGDWQAKDLNLQPAPMPPSLRDVASYGVQLDQRGVLWFGCGRGLCRLESGRVTILGATDGLPAERWDAILGDPYGSLWIRSSRRLLERPRNATRFVPRDAGLPQSSDFGALSLDRSGRLFVPTDLGLAYLDGDRWRLIGAKQGLATGGTSCLLQDREDSVWIGLRGSGLSRWLGYGEWESWTQAEGLSSSTVWAIRRDRSGALWVGTDLGLNRMPPASSRAPTGAFRAWSENKGLSGNRVRSIALSADGSVWAGSYPGGLSRLDPRSGKLRLYDASSGLAGDRVLHLMIDSEDRLWVSTRTGLYRSSPVGPAMRFERVRPPLTDDNEIFFESLLDRRGTIWVAGSRGLARLESGNWTRFTTGDGLKIDPVGYLAEAPDGSLWIGYREARGLSRLRFDGGPLRIDHFSKKDGLRSDQAIFVGVDARGRVWFGSDNGVDVFDGSAWRHYGSAAGLIWDDCDGNAFFAERDGSVWIGTSRGLSRFRPLDRPTPADPPPVILSSLKLGNRWARPEEELRVPHLESSFEATAAALTFRDENIVQFRYRLLGLQKDWVQTTSRRVYFAHLNPGAYTYEVMARSAAGVWSSQPARFSFRVLPSWWQAWWFQVLAATMLLLLGRGFWQWRLLRLLDQQRRLEQAIEQRTAELCLEKARTEQEKTVVERQNHEIEALLEEARLAHRVKEDMVASIDGIVWEADPAAFRFSFVSQRAAGLLGYPLEAWMQPNFWAEHLHPDDLNWATDLRVAAGADCRDHQLEYRMITADGRAVWLRDVVAVVSEAGRPVKLRGLMVDVTERKRAEAAVRESEERFRALFQEAPVAYHEIDRDGVVQRVNRAECQLLGFEPSEILGKSICDFVAPEQQAASRAAVRRKMAGEQPLKPFRRDYVRRDGRRLVLEIHENFICDDAGGVIGTRSAMLDVTESQHAEDAARRAQEAAEAASRAKSEFLANMSHEIRTPMNGILGMTALALATPLNPEQRDYIETAKISAESLLVLLNDILDFSKIEAGKLDLDLVDFSLPRCLDHAVRTLRTGARQKGLDLCWQAGPGVPEGVVGDFSRLRQVLLNLIGNAIKFTEHGCIDVRIGVEWAAEGQVCLRFSVSGSGIGIPGEQQRLIFEAFRQADGSMTRKYGGTGLGLAICSKLVQLLGGRIWVESNPGHGSTFHFTAVFGLSTAPILTGEATAPPSPEQQTRPLRILLAEDNRVNQKVAQRLLEKMGHHVVVANNGREALDELERRNLGVDVVLMDVQMPELDGLQATAAIRQKEKLTGMHLPILAMTAHTIKGDRERCLEAGMDGYVSKPIRALELWEALAQFAPPVETPAAT